MIKKFDKWRKSQNISEGELFKALNEVIAGQYEASLGGSLYKKRVRFENAGKRGSGRTIICLKKEKVAFYIYGFRKKEKENLTQKESAAFKSFAKVLLSLDDKSIEKAIKEGEFLEVKDEKINI